MGSKRYVWRGSAIGVCAYCGNVHALEIEYRCVGCDHGVCALCVLLLRERAEAYCPECAPAGGEER